MLPTIRFAIRLLLRRKAFTAISLFGVALTLLVLVVAAAMIDGVIGASAPQRRAPRMLLVTQARLASPDGSSTGPFGLEFAGRVLRDLPGAEDVSVFTTSLLADAWSGDVKASLLVKGTDAAFWRVHDFTCLHGELPGEDDDAEARAVAVLSRSASLRLFGREDALGSRFDMNGRAWRVAAIVRDVSFLRFAPHADAWVPLSSMPRVANRSGLRGDLQAVILARSRSDLDAIRAEFDSRVASVPVPEAGQVLSAHADTIPRAVARRMFPASSDDPNPSDPLASARNLLVALTAAFLALPVLNLVNLELSRIVERAPEIGVRKAFGATPGRLVAQFVAEKVVLVLLGGVIAFALAPFVLSAINGSGIIPSSDLSVNHRVLGWGLLLALAFGVLSGGWPAWRLARLHPVEALRGRAR